MRNGFFGQLWPDSVSILNMNCAICWECLQTDFTTVNISGFIINIPRSSKNVKSKTQSAGNQRHITSLVGTSETTRAATNPSEFCEWLSGVIDGDGSLQVSKQGYTSLEITTGSEDLPLLEYIQTRLGGSVKARSGVKAYRYRLHHRAGMFNLIQCINGNIRHSSRLVQLHRVCQQLNLPVVKPVDLKKESAWFAGFFDADGTITYSLKPLHPQLSVRVTNKLLQDVHYFVPFFGGYIYYDSSQNGYYQWSIQGREDILRLHSYFKNYCRSYKSKRFHLVEEFYMLRDFKAFKPDSPHHNN